MRSGFTAKRVCYGIVHSGNKGLNFCAWRLRMISFNLPAPCDTGITHCSRGLPSFLHCCPYPPLPPRAVRVRHVSWSTWGISSSLGHLGLEVDACGSSLPFPWFSWEDRFGDIGNRWTFPSGTHGSDSHPLLFPGGLRRVVAHFSRPYFIQGLCSCFHTAHKMSHPCDLTC